MYKRVLDYLTIKPSDIEGLGLFTVKRIPAERFLGIGLIKDPKELAENGVWRTPLGGFINHSDTPNCVKWQENQRYYMKTIKPIKKGEELFLKYTFYSVK